MADSSSSRLVSRPGNATAWIAILLLIVSAYVLWSLLELRLRTGDVYPVYSTLRADPLGAKALHESLELTGKVEVLRSLTSRPRIAHPTETALFFLGLQPDDAVDKRALELAEQGGRLVLAFLPSNTGKNDWWRRAKQAMPPPTPDTETTETTVRIDTLGLSFARAKRGSSPRVSLASGPGLPNSLAWHGAHTFATLDDAWRVVYRLNDEPVLIEKHHGQGTIVLVADGYFLSNEALRDERESTLIAWLVDDKPRVVFDEAHLGVSGDPGVVSLARNLGLEGVAVALLVLGILFLWRSSVRFLPALEPHHSAAGTRVRGKDSQEGFVSLLSRSTPQADLIKTCVEEWRKSQPPGSGLAKERAVAMEAALVEHLGKPPRQQDNLSTYRTLVRILTERSWKIPSNS